MLTRRAAEMENGGGAAIRTLELFNFLVPRLIRMPAGALARQGESTSDRNLCRQQLVLKEHIETADFEEPAVLKVRPDDIRITQCGQACLYGISAVRLANASDYFLGRNSNGKS